ncbi:MAG: NADH-quinone oxidoreductase subunit M, partial [Candidatus Rokubacteria bacterium]|nr:NADH-quinone oxidoreductase subunit M [Candidatus Rokubacteria bacterium]
MEWSEWALSLAVFLPGVGALIVMLIPRAEEQLIKAVALVTTLATFGVVVGILADFDYDRSGELQFELNNRWIDVINSRYHVAIDGISLPLLALSAFVTLLCVIYSWNHFPEPHNPKAFLALMLVLEVGMNGTFVAQDLILFFIFFEVVLLPMFFMIGVWGGPNREYASIKFFLFTLFGSAMMLLGFLALYFKVDVPGGNTFDMVALSEAAGAGLTRGTANLIFA